MSTTFPELISRSREELNSVIGLVNDYATELDNLRTQDAPDPTRVADIRSKRAAAEARVEALRSKLELFQRESDEDDKLTRAAQETHETETSRQFRISHRDDTPGAFYTNGRSNTYNEGNQAEFLRDLFAFSTGRLQPASSERLLKHENESRAAGLFSERAGNSSSFQGVIPPNYLIDQYALVARAGRPIANTVQHLPLPETGMSLVIPKGTTGVSTGVQASENSTVATTDEVWSNITVPVVTVAGYNPVSRQSIERSEGVDQIIFGDLAASYAVSLDQQVINGTGSSGQALGILNTPGINQASAFTAAATVATMYSKTAGQLNAIETSRYLAPDIIYMHPRRWNWLISQLDSSTRPLATPEANGPTNSIAISTIPIDTGSARAVGSLFGMPVVTDASIPVNLGTGSLEDVIITARKEDMLLWEDPAAPFTLAFEQTSASSLTVTLVAYGYFAFTAGRFPTSVGLVGGNAGTSGYGLTTVIF